MSTVNGAWRGPNIVKTGLVHYIDPSSPNSYNPLTFGSRAIDIMKTGLDGNYINAAYNTFGAGSILLTGVSSYVDYGSNAIFAFGTSNFAIDAWIYKTTSGVSQGMWSTYRTGASNVGVKFGFGGGALDFRVGNDYGGTLNAVTDAVSLTINTWFHVVATRLNGTLFLYKNGVSVGTPAADSQNITQSQMILGPWYPDLIAFLYTGYIASIRTYKGYGFTQADVTRNFNAQRSRFGV